MYLFCIEAFGTRRKDTALLTAIMVALACAQVRWGAEVRMYSLGTATCALSSWALLHAVRPDGERLRRWIVYAALTLAFMYTHYFAVFSLAAQVLFVAALLAMRFWRARSHSRNTWKSFRNAGCAAGMVVAGFAPWMAHLVSQSRHVQENFWIEEVSPSSVPAALYHLFVLPPVYERPGPPGDPMATCMVVVVCAASLAACLYRPQAQDWLVVLSAVFPILLGIAASEFGAPIFFYRYLLFAQLFLIVAIARAVSLLPRSAFSVVSVIAIVNMALLLLSYWDTMDFANRPGMRSALRHIQKHKSAHEPVIACSAMYYLPALYHAGTDVEVLLYEPDIDGTPHFEGRAALVPRDIIDPSTMLNRSRIWTVGGGYCSPPGNWRLDSSIEFAEGSIFQASVAVRTYESLSQDR